MSEYLDIKEDEYGEFRRNVAWSNIRRLQARINLESVWPDTDQPYKDGHTRVEVILVLCANDGVGSDCKEDFSALSELKNVGRFLESGHGSNVTGFHVEGVENIKKMARLGIAQDQILKVFPDALDEPAPDAGADFGANSAPSQG